jgi:hypothetical protein
MTTPMKNTPHPAKKITDAETERALNDALRLSASVFPQTDEDMEALQSETDPSLVSTPDVLKFKKLLAGAKDPMATPAPTGSIAKFQLPEITENWAMAARNGAQITPEVRAKMDAARASTAKKRPSK